MLVDEDWMFNFVQKSEETKKYISLKVQWTAWLWEDEQLWQEQSDCSLNVVKNGAREGQRGEGQIKEDLIMDHNTNLRFYSDWDGKSMVGFEQRNYLIYIPHLLY